MEKGGFLAAPGEQYIDEHRRGVVSSATMAITSGRRERDGDLWMCGRGSSECESDERFAGFDECPDHCFHGSCQQSGGEEGGSCAFCP